MRGRKSNTGTIKSVLDTLRRYPHGLTLRELSRRSGVPKSTLAYQLSRGLKPHIDETIIRPKNRTIARLVKLKERGGKNEEEHSG